MIFAATKKDVPAAAKLASELWPDNDMAELEREFSKILAGKNALIALYTDGGEPEAFAQCQLRTDCVEAPKAAPLVILMGSMCASIFAEKG